MAIVTLDDYLNTVIDKMLTSQDLCKLLYYDNDTPLSQSDLADTSVLSSKENPDRRIFAIPFDPDVHAAQKTTIHVEVNQSEKAEDVFYKNVNITFIILCHNHLWELETGTSSISLRPNSIVNKLFDLFYNQGSIGLGTPFYSRTENIYFNDEISGYQLVFQNVDFSVNN